MNAVQIFRDVVLEPADNDRLANLCGQFDEHLRQIERRLDVEMASRGNRVRVTGRPGAAEVGGDVLLSLFAMTDRERLDPECVHMTLQESFMDNAEESLADDVGEVANDEVVTIQTRRKLISASGDNQYLFMHVMRHG